MLRRRWPIFWLVVVSTVVATIIGLNVTKSYTATAEVLVDPSESRIVDIPTVAQGIGADRWNMQDDIETQIQLIASPAVLARAVSRLGGPEGRDLADQDQGPMEGDAAPVDGNGWLRDQIPPMGAVAAGRPTSIDPDAEGPQDLTIDALRGGLSVGQPSAHVLSISYTSHSPEAAARIANAVAESYVEAQLDDKLTETERAIEWLAEHVKVLRGQVLRSERAVEEFRTANGLTTAMDAQQLAAVTTSLIEVRAELATRQSRLRHLQGLRDAGVGFEAAPEMMSSPLIVNLREREFDLGREEAQLVREFGENHPRLLQLRAEQDKVAFRIQQEINNVIANLENEISVAQSREAALEQSLENAKSESALTAQAGIELRELTREAEADQSLYQTVLTRLKDVEQQMGLVQADVRLMSAAAVPGSPSSAPPHLFGFIGFTASLFAGVVLALLLEQVETTLRTDRHIESVLGIPSLGLVPGLKGADRRNRPHQQLVDHPGSAFAQGVQQLYTRIQLSGRTPKVIMVTSALPGEGKTSLASSLAVCGAQLGQKVLLVDLDLRRPAVCREFVLGDDSAFQRVLAGQIDLRHAVQPQPQSGLDVLAGQSSHSNPIVVLTSQHMNELMDEAVRRYDVVVVDAPPVLGVPDVKALSPLADAIVLVVHWHRTKGDAVAAAVKELQELSARVLGAVLNQVDLEKHGSYAYRDSAQYYKKYRRYYTEKPAATTDGRLAQVLGTLRRLV